MLYQVIGKFAELDLHPDAVSNIEMGYLYEELIRRFSELSNETAGEHFTPREVIRLDGELALYRRRRRHLDEAEESSRPSATPRAVPAACSPLQRITCAH